VALSQDGHVVHDLNGALVDLGGDLQGLEEGGLGGLQASGTSRHDDGALGDAADTSGRLLAVCKNDGADIAKVLVGEDEGDVAFQLISESEQRLVLVFLAKLLDHKAHHCVLADEHLGLATHGHTHLVHLVGSDVVELHNEHAGVV